MIRKKLSTWAKENGVHYRTAMVWLHAGTLPVRVSSSDQRADLTRQIDRLRVFASGCGLVEAGNRVSQSGFRCLSCGHEINADLNAAINILVAGSCPETENACGEDVRPDRLRLVGQTSVKQESAGEAVVQPLLTV